MKKVRLLHRLSKDEDGAAMVEYVMLLALILFVSITAIQSLGNKAFTIWNTIQTDMPTAPR